MTKDTREELLNEVPLWMKNFDNNNGGITYEFSVHKDDLNETFEILNSYHSSCANWFAFTCKTCVGYHGEGFVHIELEHDKYAEANDNFNNLLARTNYKRG